MRTCDEHWVWCKLSTWKCLVNYEYSWLRIQKTSFYICEKTNVAAVTYIILKCCIHIRYHPHQHIHKWSPKWWVISSELVFFQSIKLKRFSAAFHIEPLKPFILLSHMASMYAFAPDQPTVLQWWIMMVRIRYIVICVKMHVHQGRFYLWRASEATVAEAIAPPSSIRFYANEIRFASPLFKTGTPKNSSVEMQETVLRAHTLIAVFMFMCIVQIKLDAIFQYITASIAWSLGESISKKLRTIDCC